MLLSYNIMRFQIDENKIVYNAEISNFSILDNIKRF